MRKSTLKIDRYCQYPLVMFRVSPIFWGKFLKWLWQTPICDLPPFNNQNSLHVHISIAGHFFFNAWKSKSKVRAFSIEEDTPPCFTKVSSSKERKTHGNFSYDLMKSTSNWHFLTRSLQPIYDLDAFFVSYKKLFFCSFVPLKRLGDVMCSSTFWYHRDVSQDELEPYQEVWGP